jgi:hypothetical protein
MKDGLAAYWEARLPPASDELLRPAAPSQPSRTPAEALAALYAAYTSYSLFLPGGDAVPLNEHDLCELALRLLGKLRDAAPQGCVPTAAAVQAALKPLCAPAAELGHWRMLGRLLLLGAASSDILPAVTVADPDG